MSISLRSFVTKTLDNKYHTKTLRLIGIDRKEDHATRPQSNPRFANHIQIKLFNLQDNNNNDKCIHPN